MSLINKMLQELDKRHASHGVGGQPSAQKLVMSLRPMPAGGLVGSDVFWWIMAVIMLVLIVWLGWVMWQLTPRPVVTDLAYQHRQRMESAQARSRLAAPSDQGAAQNAPGGIGAVTEPAASTPGAPAVVESAGAQKSELPPQVDMLRLATAISTPIPERRAAKAPAPPAEVGKSAPAKADIARADAGAAKADAAKPEAAKADAAKSAIASAPAAKAAPAARIEDPKVVPPPAPKVVPPPAPKPTQVVASVDSGRIDKRVTTTPAERAEAEYRRAVTFVNQGRVSEGMEGLRSALTMDAAHVASRQTLVSLLMEQRRFDEAFGFLLQGLELNPANSGFAMLVARIMVERKDMEGALRVLQKHAPTAGSNAEYHAFSAALYQRLGRHSDAVEEYQTALRLSPQTGAWWVGLGISQEASEQRKDAATSFRRAQTSGNLSPDLVAFVDQRLRQLR
jgi:MSHA biogenesis protein MshN